ncbi:MAG: hypothetical protein JWP37_3123 [Mucilaginibacter sp.]|nr:hypothetical protein [Mucilaginibacter sp.]
MKKLPFLIALILVTSFTTSYAQRIDLINLYKTHKLITYPNYNISVLNEGDKHGLSQNDIIWLKDFSFSTGSIELDMRGKNVFQQSFLGIAFHGIDTITYDAIYFRPFNFQSPDALRKKHTVQYISQPDYPWERLRNEYPLVYENAVNPFPEATDWFHARIVVEKDSIKVYVNHSAKASLKVKKLNSRTNGLLGLWNFGLDGNFANLVIKKD